MIQMGVCAPKLGYIGVCLLDHKLMWEMTVGHWIGVWPMCVVFRQTLSCGCVGSDAARGMSAGSACLRVNSQPARELHVTIPDPHIEVRTTTGRLRYTYDDCQFYWSIRVYRDFVKHLKTVY